MPRHDGYRVKGAWKRISNHALSAGYICHCLGLGGASPLKTTFRFTPNYPPKCRHSTSSYKICKEMRSAFNRVMPCNTAPTGFNSVSRNSAIDFGMQLPMLGQLRVACQQTICAMRLLGAAKARSHRPTGGPLIVDLGLFQPPPPFQVALPASNRLR